jgi:RimJ/RimL family protein N-acetyltransferase
VSYRVTRDAQGQPVLWTERLRLRLPADRDLEASASFWASERSHQMGGPWTCEKTRESHLDLVDQWRRNGFSLFTVTLRDSDNGIGGIGPFYPKDHPEPELGWSLWDVRNEGRGFAYEAAVAVRDWFFDTTSFDTAVSYTDPANTRSHRLCERLGAAIDPDANHPYGDEPTLTYRHFRGASA